MTINKELKSHQYARTCYICGKIFLKNIAKDKNYRKIRDHCHFTDKYRGAANSIYNLRFNVSNKILLVFRNGSNCNKSIRKKVANEFEGKFECFWENTKKYRTLIVSIGK